MHIALVTPAPARSLSGNRATANRWARLLRGLGHRVDVMVDYSNTRADLLIALHAWRSAAAVRLFAEQHPQRPLVVVLTGTDAYRFIHSHPDETIGSLALADRIVGDSADGVFWIRPHPRYAEQAAEQAQNRLTGGAPVMPRGLE